MRKLLVALSGEAPVLRDVEPRAADLKPGTLCEIRFDDRVRLCVVDRIIADVEIEVRPLPEPPAPRSGRARA